MDSIVEDLRILGNDYVVSGQLVVTSQENPFNAEYNLQAQKYIEKNSELNQLLEIVSERDYVAEWKPLEIQSRDLVKQISEKNNKIESLETSLLLESSASQKYDQLNAEIQTLEDEITSLRESLLDILTEINAIEQASIDSMKLEPLLHEKLYSIENEIYQKFLNPNSSTYVGDTFVDTLYVDHVQKKVIVLVDIESELTVLQ
mgnify:FL=1